MKELPLEKLLKARKVGTFFDFLYSFFGTWGMIGVVSALYNGELAIVGIAFTLWFAYKLGEVQKQNRKLDAEIKSRI